MNQYIICYNLNNLDHKYLTCLSLYFFIISQVLHQRYYSRNTIVLLSVMWHMGDLNIAIVPVVTSYENVTWVCNLTIMNFFTQYIEIITSLPKALDFWRSNEIICGKTLQKLKVLRECEGQTLFFSVWLYLDCLSSLAVWFYSGIQMLPYCNKFYFSI